MVEATVQQSLPERVADGNRDENSRRRGVYGEDYSIVLDPRVHADEGSYFVLQNDVPATAIAGHAAPTTHDTEKAFIMLRHGGELGVNSKRTYLDYLKLVVTAIGTNGTLNYATHTIDTGRTYASGGVELRAVNPNMLSGLTLDLNVVRAGPVVPGEANSSDARIVAHTRVREVIPVVGDVILFKFGSEPEVGAMVMGGTTQLERVIHCPPVIFGPGQSYHLVLWRASQSAAASYEVEIGLWQR